MPQSLAQIYLHIIFSTKNRQPFIEPAIIDDLHTYLGGACRDLNCPSLIVGGIADHVHILCRFGRMIEVADLLRELKKESSKWVKEQGHTFSSFAWQNGYGAFSVSPSHVPVLRRYIANQEEHHKTESFQDEYRRILRKYGVEYDERYVWD